MSNGFPFCPITEEWHEDCNWRRSSESNLKAFWIFTSDTTPLQFTSFFLLSCFLPHQYQRPQQLPTSLISIVAKCAICWRFTFLFWMAPRTTSTDVCLSSCIAALCICHAVVAFNFSTIWRYAARTRPPFSTPFNAVFVKIACSCTSAFVKDFPTRTLLLLFYATSHGRKASQVVIFCRIWGKKMIVTHVTHQSESIQLHDLWWNRRFTWQPNLLIGYT